MIFGEQELAELMTYKNSRHFDLAFYYIRF